jgi:hypothetical protein
VKFPDLVKDPTDALNYTMDWTSRLNGLRIASVEIEVSLPPPFRAMREPPCRN